MSLDFNYKAVARKFAIMLAPSNRPGDYKKGDAIIHPVMNTVIWRCLALGVNAITEKNYEEVYLRNKLYETLFPEMKMTVPQPLPLDGHESRHLTKDDFFHLIGLRTNVTSVGDAAWRKQIVQQFTEEQRAKSNLGNTEGETVYKAYFERFPDCIASEKD